MTGEPEHIGRDALLKLDKAVKVAFPYEGMTVSGLRREAARGRVAIETIAGNQLPVSNRGDENKFLHFSNLSLNSLISRKISREASQGLTNKTPTRAPPFPPFAHECNPAHRDWSCRSL
jgi:hypothetical protein